MATNPLVSDVFSEGELLIHHLARSGFTVERAGWVELPSGALRLLIDTPEVRSGAWSAYSRLNEAFRALKPPTLSPIDIYLLSSPEFDEFEETGARRVLPHLQGWRSAPAPAIKHADPPFQDRPAITDANGLLITDQNPATPGQPIVIYMTGLGEVDLRSGRALAPVRVEFDGLVVSPDYAGIGSSADLYQVNAFVPAGLDAGTHQVVVSVGEVRSNPGEIPVRP